MPSEPVHSSLPVRLIPGDDKKQPRAGIGLCLSGGGYRATVFHLGALIRLNELGLLPKLDRISSVSGGSITAGFLGLKWSALDFDGSGIASNLVAEVVTPIRAMATHTLDVAGVFGGILLPGTVAEHIANAYRKYLFGDSTLQSLPDSPRFVMNATNIQTGSLWRFSKPYMGDYKVGLFRNPTLDLAVAVGASSAFPPVLSRSRPKRFYSGGRSQSSETPVHDACRSH
jgi:NTE family protein